MQDVNFSYTGKNFIVVGASSGIGKQIALELSQAGANVLTLARRVEIMEQLKENQGAGKIIPAFVDVTAATPSDWDSVIKNFVSEYGKINGGVYTAGVGGLTVLRSLNEDFAKLTMDTSYWGMLHFLQSATKKRFSAEGASFVVFASIVATHPEKGQLVYASAKAAVKNAVQIIAKEICANKQRINSISPGTIDTPMTINAGLKTSERYKDYFWLGEGSEDKVSGMVLFLLSSRADWITGTDIVIDGGQLLGAL